MEYCEDKNIKITFGKSWLDREDANHFSLHMNQFYSYSFFSTAWDAQGSVQQYGFSSHFTYDKTETDKLSDLAKDASHLMPESKWLIDDYH